MLHMLGMKNCGISLKFFFFIWLFIIVFILCALDAISDFISDLISWREIDI